MSLPENTRDVPIPEKLKGRPIYKGFPIPFTVYINKDGVPDFRVVDEKNRMQCMENELCSLCGQPLVKPYVFIGGPKSTENRTYVDGPMHEECALYATKVCSYLVDPDYHQRSLDSSKEKLLREGGKTVTLGQMTAGRPSRMALLYTNSYRLSLLTRPIYYLAGYPIKVDWSSIPERTQSATI
jgi:hypothetical protein